MKIRIAKKELKKIISEAYRIDKRRVKLTRTYFAFKSGYGYRYRDDSIGFLRYKNTSEKETNCNQEELASVNKRYVQG